MQSPLFFILGLILLSIGGYGLLTGKIMAGSKGFTPHYYDRISNPFLFYLFAFMYIGIGIFVIVMNI